MVDINTNAALELLRMPKEDMTQANAALAQGIMRREQRRRSEQAANMLAQAGPNVSTNTLAQIAAVDPSIAQMFAQQQAQQQRQQFQEQQYTDERTMQGQERVSTVSREADKLGTRAYLEAMAQGQTPKDAERKGADSRNAFISARTGSGEIPQSMATHLIGLPFAPVPMEKTSQELRNESTEMQIKQRAELAKLEHERNLAEIEARKRAAGAPRASGSRPGGGGSAPTKLPNNPILMRDALALIGAFAPEGGPVPTLGDIMQGRRDVKYGEEARRMAGALADIRDNDPEKYKQIYEKTVKTYGGDPIVASRQIRTDNASAKGVAEKAIKAETARITAYGHFNTLGDAGEKILKSGGVKTLNSFRMKALRESGNPDVAQFDAALAAVTEEAANYFSGGGTATVSDKEPLEQRTQCI